jgi:hypothetical protein
MAEAVEVFSVSGQVARALSGYDIDLPVVCRIAKANDEVVGGGGLAFNSGRCWLFFFVNENAPKNVIRLIIKEFETLKRRALQFGHHEIYVTRDAGYETSERLLKLTGFEKTGEILADQEVWVWRS